MSAKIKNRHERQITQRKQKHIRQKFLIVCEGERTEPNYFKALTKGIESIHCEIRGKGKNTKSLVKEAITLKANNDFDKIWVVFDKDEVPDNDFNDAIKKAEKNGIECAWSNAAFELWFLYHFENVTAYLPRDAYQKELSRAVNKSGKYNKKSKYQYDKTDTENFSIMTSYGSQEHAILRAETQSRKFSNNDYANHNPCTMVFKLVKQLIGQDKKFNEEIDRIVESSKRK
ncbi:MAG: RloB family protein [Bacteroidales bacterium]|nr:RloB family protein [Bacteroidales bacterium]